ncbi:tyrosine-type recombinase/integrase, partial [Acinetobacter terrae]
GVRGAELLLSEPHHFDLDNKIWKIPALHIKQFRRKVILGHDIPDFLVPLSDQAILIIRSALEWSHGEKYVFYSPKNKNRHLHFNTLNTIIRKMNYSKNELSLHGLRSTFSTILNESGFFQQNWIEAQLSHTDKNKTRASYNHAEYLTQRIEMMQWWGDYLGSIK